MAFDCCTLPADDERSIRPFELAPVGSRRFTKSPGDFIHRGIITLSRDCVVSAPLPGLSPCCSDSPLSHWRGDFPQPVDDERQPTVSHPPSPGGRLLRHCSYKSLSSTAQPGIHITRVGEKTFRTVTRPVAGSKSAERPRSPSISSATILIGNSLRTFRASRTLSLPMFAI
jgi:hypothetical protein